MRSTNENSFTIPAWGVSLGFHAGVVWLAVLFTAQVKPVLMEEVFKWDVALVDTVASESPPPTTTEPAPLPRKTVVPPAEAPPVVARRPVEPPTDTVSHRVAPQQTMQMVHPESQPPKPLEQHAPPPPAAKVEPPAPVAKAAEETPVEPVEQQVVEVPKTRAEPVMPVKEPEPAHSSEPVMAQRQPVVSPPTEAVESRPAETPAPPEPAPLASSHAETAPSAPAAAQEAPIQTAKADPRPSSAEAPVQASKADHRWLAESLWRRVAELKRYPSSARLNGQEGKVVLKAVIRSDGHLIDVTVQKSSGHQILDAAAIEAVKLACPLHMKHAINKPEIVVSLPIVYSLAN